MNTTIAGIGTILAAIGGALILIGKGQIMEAFTALMAGVSAGLGLIKAKDAKGA